VRCLTQSRDGRIKHIGLSEVSSNTLRRACKIAPVTAVQIEYSPFTRDIEGETGKNILATCRELGVAVVCYSPLGRGLLTGDFSSKDAISGAGDGRAAQFPRFTGDNLEANAKIVSQFKEFADRKNCTPSQLAIAWLLKQGSDIFPIPGTKRVEKLDENWAALHIDLSDDEEAEIRAFVTNNEMAGYRSTLAGMHSAFVDTKEEN
jgi:aryl-alcohol dehydrogenase-like predicted oxidoreductase